MPCRSAAGGKRQLHAANLQALSHWDIRGSQNPEESRGGEDGVAVDWEVGPGRGQHSLSLLLSASPHGTCDNLEAVVTEPAVS